MNAVNAVASVENELAPKLCRHTAVVLFYKYFCPKEEFPCLHKNRRSARFYENQLAHFQKSLCHRLGLSGRVLIASEGINGTLSAESEATLQEYIQIMENFDLLKDVEQPDNDLPNSSNKPHFLFQGVDWKTSIADPISNDVDFTFPDLKISVVSEIISTGGKIDLDEIPECGGTHLSPSEFHQAILDGSKSSLDGKEVVLIDVRNTFEYDIGHFRTSSLTPALNPETATFSSFDDTFCAKRANELKDKKVLMYCTGGIRCEKASVMLKKRGVKDVYQLSGGIHRYLEEFGEDGLFRGLNFVFDQRVALKPSDCKFESGSAAAAAIAKIEGGGGAVPSEKQQQKHEIVGQCLECRDPFDELSGARICTVCRDLVLVCPSCCQSLREYHCKRHQGWKHCYFVFLESFGVEDLQAQHAALLALRESPEYFSQKNARRTLFRQMEKIRALIQLLQEGSVSVDRNAPRRCRSCMETSLICNGLCWGFWKLHQSRTAPSRSGCDFNNNKDYDDERDVVLAEPLLPIGVGDLVLPGSTWNTTRYGVKEESSIGRVVECKSWGAGGSENDCVVVEWLCESQDTTTTTTPSLTTPLPYRWGVVGLNGQRLYDLQKKDEGKNPSS